MNTSKNQIEQLAQLVDRHQDELFRFAYFRTGCRADAEDIVQEVLLKLFRSECNLSHVDDVKRYLMRSIANRCTDYHRRTRHTVPLRQAEAAEDEQAEEALRADFERIEALLGQLPGEQAEVIRRKSVDGQTFRQIAEQVQCSESTAKSRFRYGIDKLRRLLND